MVGASGEPRVSVIITCYNYGHFLRDCISSAMLQGRAADEIIVIDDGSTDGTQTILDEYRDRIDVVRIENSGQAAAFNAGFARATGDVIFFLDCDDLLRPNAIEVVLAHWNDDLALLCFLLETIDTAGRSTGLYRYTLEADDGDNLPRLLRAGNVSGPFAFCPTSGNAFSQRFLECVLPMPEAEWRICADAYLVRAAAVKGRIVALRRVLAGYRMHGGNNYARPETPEPWSLRQGLRNLRTLSAALEGLACTAALVCGQDDPAALRLALRLRALEVQAITAAWSGDMRPFLRCFGRSLAAAASNRAPLADRIGAVALTVRFGLGLGGVRRQLRENPHVAPSAREDWRPPCWLAAPGLEARLRQMERPRWLETLPCGAELRFDRPGPQLNILSEGWIGDLRQGLRTSDGPVATLEFALDPGRGAVEVELCLAAVADVCDTGLQVKIAGLEGRIWTGYVCDPTAVRFVLDRDTGALRQAVWLEISCALPVVPNGQPPRRLTRQRFVLHHLKATIAAMPALYPLLAPGEQQMLGDVLASDPAGDGWYVGDDGVASIEERDAHLRLSVENGAAPATLRLLPAADSPPGWLRISCAGGDLFTGEFVPGRPLRLLLPQESAGSAWHELHLAVASPQRTDGAAVRFSTIELAQQAPFPWREYDRLLPPLDIGQTVFVRRSPHVRHYLASGWSEREDGGFETTAAEATLAFCAPDDGASLVLRARLRPSLAPPEGRRHLVGFSAGGSLIHAVDLVGEGEVAVPLPEAARSGNHGVEIAFHSVLAGGSDTAALPERAAPIELVSLALDGTWHEGTQAPPRIDDGYPMPEVLRLVDEARVATASSDTAGAGTRELRATLLRLLTSCDCRALDTVAADPSKVVAIERLGHLAGADAPLETDRASDALRAVLADMLTVPACRAASMRDLMAVPAILWRDPEAFVTYLTREPEFETTEEVSGYVAFLTRTLAQVDGLLRRNKPDSVEHRVAVGVLTRLRMTRALFGTDNLVPLIRLRGRCFERMLLQSGARLSLSRQPRLRQGKLRIGVLVRDLRPRPETWAAFGMYRGLDRDRFETILITLDDPAESLDPGDRFVRTICLRQPSAEAAVAAIRDLDLDMFVLGTFFMAWEQVPAIVAHRLAPVQLVSAAVAPSTLGFRNFDRVLTCAASEAGEAAQAQYTEPIAWIGGPSQCCYDFANPDGDPDDRLATRRRLGLQPDAVLMASTAMAHKIHDKLLDAWVEVLAAVAGGRIVLYPFASNWALGFQAERFLERIRRQCERAGVAADRFVVLDEAPLAEVRSTLRASDLYLDSFPYSGATTVCEAMSCGLPAVSLAGGCLRSLTGASWVRAYGLEELVASSPEDYVSRAARFAGDAAARRRAREAIGARLAGGRPPHFDPKAFGAAFGEALLDVAGASGLFVGLNPSPRPVPAEASQTSSSRRAVPLAEPQAPETAAAGRRWPPSRTEARRAVVIGLGRTGSSLLCHLLSTVPGVRFDHELFNEREIGYGNEPVRDPVAVGERDADPVGWLKRHFSVCEADGYDVIGFKLFLHHNRDVISDIAIDPRCRLILLTRANLLAMYSSLRIAQMTDRWSRSEREPPHSPRIPFDQLDFESFEKDVASLAEIRAQIVAQADRAVASIEYTTILAASTAERLSDFLEHRIRWPKDTLLKKQNPDRIIDRFTRPELVHQYLRCRGKLDWAVEG